MVSFRNQNRQHNGSILRCFIPFRTPSRGEYGPEAIGDEAFPDDIGLRFHEGDENLNFDVLFRGRS